MMATDPWAPFTGKRNHGIAPVEETYAKTTMDRAKKRVAQGTVTSMGQGVWRVDGLPMFSDSQFVYTVTAPRIPQEHPLTPWHCTCYDTAHGDTRARKGCTHVLAAKIYQQQQQEDAGTDHGGYAEHRGRGTDRNVQPVLPVVQSEHARSDDQGDGGVGIERPAGVHRQDADVLADGAGVDRGTGSDESHGGSGVPGELHAADRGTGSERGVSTLGVDVDDLYGCEDCEWVGVESTYPDHYLAAHVAAPGKSRVHESTEVLAGPENGTQTELFGPVGHGDIPDPHDPMFGTPGLPEWVTEFRPHQWDAICEAMELYESGHEVVFLDAPTGSGKTLIGETIRRLVGERALYVCSGKDLQDQFLKDYPYAKVLKGRSNYPTQTMPFPTYNCGDCTKNPADGDAMECEWCPNIGSCGYEVAKRQALGSNIAVVNTAYLMAEANHIGNIVKGRELMVMDECDVLERELMGFVEFNLGDRTLASLGVDAPAKGIHKKNIVKWFWEVLHPAVQAKLQTLPHRTSDVQVIRRRASLERLLQEIPKIAGEIDDDNWVRDNKAGPIVMKPVKVDAYGVDNLWTHGDKWLCMSATIVSAEEMVESLGLSDRKWGLVRVPMTFPVENRQIHMAPVANMTMKGKNEEGAWEKMTEAVRRIADKHKGERILVHTVSYDLAKYLYRELGRFGLPVVTYGSSGEREGAIARYRRDAGSIMLAPSLDRGVDFKGDDCRVVVVAKVPFPYLGDTQVSQRLHGPGGQAWYTVQTIRSMVQMTGRGVRSADDYCTTYILDKQFQSNVWKKNKKLLPEWWVEAVDTRYDGRWLYR